MTNPAMKRVRSVQELEKTLMVYMHKVLVNSEGYEKGTNNYYGIGEPVYQASVGKFKARGLKGGVFTEDDTLCVRAHNRHDAMAAVRKEIAQKYPDYVVMFDRIVGRPAKRTKS